MPATVMIACLGFTFRVWELFVLTLVLQVGMLPVMAAEFHRITFAGPFVGRGAADGGDCTGGIRCFDYRVGYSGAGQIADAALVVGHAGAGAGSALVFATAAVELSRSGSTDLGDDSFSFYAGLHRHCSSHQCAALTIDRRNFVRGGGGAGHSDRGFAVHSAMVGWKTGSVRPRCGTRRFSFCRVSRRHDVID